MIATTIVLFACGLKWIAAKWRTAKYRFALAWRLRFGFSSECRTVSAMKDQFEQLRLDENSARAQLMQLRVYGKEIDGGRDTGFGVTAFIPHEVLQGIRDSQNRGGRIAFTRRVADVLVYRALKGLWDMSGKNNKVTALVFEPVGRNSAQVSTWLEGGRRPIHIAPMVGRNANAIKRKYGILMRPVLKSGSGAMQY